MFTVAVQTSDYRETLSSEIFLLNVLENSLFVTFSSKYLFAFPIPSTEEPCRCLNNKRPRPLVFVYSVINILGSK
jgi:hypothetical protein